MFYVIIRRCEFTVSGRDYCVHGSNVNRIASRTSNLMRWYSSIRAHRPRELHVPPWFGTGPQTADARSIAARYGALVSHAAEQSGRRSRPTGPAEDAGTSCQSDVVLYQGLRSEFGRWVVVVAVAGYLRLRLINIVLCHVLYLNVWNDVCDCWTGRIWRGRARFNPNKDSNSAVPETLLWQKQIRIIAYVVLYSIICRDRVKSTNNWIYADVVVYDSQCWCWWFSSAKYHLRCAPFSHPAAFTLHGKSALDVYMFCGHMRHNVCTVSARRWAVGWNGWLSSCMCARAHSQRCQ